MSIRDLMHSMIGAAAGQNAAYNPNSMMATNMGQGILAQPVREYQVRNGHRKIFHGNIEVLQVANGYVVNIGRKEGYEYETYIASTAAEVNDIIAAQIVAFRLEDKS